MRKKLILDDDFDWNLDEESKCPLTLIGAVDISYSKTND